MSITGTLNRFVYSQLSIMLLVVIVAVFLTLLGPADASAGGALTQSGKEAPFKTVEWIDLMPEDDLDALLNPPQSVTDIEDGSEEDQIASQMQNSLAAASDDRYQQALVSTRVVTEMDGKAIRIPGFVVPLEYNSEQAVTQFFLVPFFGACIHVPPPPPNQIILVNYPQGMAFNGIQDPLWVSGVLTASIQQNELATAAYVLDMVQFEAYTD